jgi:SAM-dependent methyltransferase
MANSGNPSAQSNKQKFSFYHSSDQGEALKRWMEPYTELFIGKSPVLDVGCGPGYFLELLKNRSISGFGIDCDPDMVKACTANGFEAAHLDAKAGITGLGRKFKGIHAGHVLEHLSGPDALRFLEDAAAVLEEDGVILIRTPNWENDTVRHGGFWMDMTHVRPYPLALLEKVLTDLGLEVFLKGIEKFGWEDITIAAKKPKLKINPSDLKIKMEEGLACFQSGDTAGAENRFSEIIASLPAHVDALNNLGVLKYEQGKKEEAFSFFGRAIGADDSHYEAFMNFLDTGRELLKWNEILVVLQEYQKKIIENPVLMKRAAEALTALNRKEEADKIVTRILEIIPDDADALSAMGFPKKR